MFIRFCFGSWEGRSLVVRRWSFVRLRVKPPTLCKERKEWGTLQSRFQTFRQSVISCLETGDFERSITLIGHKG
jgi:hypothetical protein